MTELGRLEKIDLRSVWISEDRDFTPWLAQDRNLEILGDAIGLELELEAQEKDVGPFRADILCKDTATGNWVLIENQLARTDHTHLGQLMTYAAGLNAVTIVWIADRFTEEHRAALDWLNKITDGSFQFFGLEIELWRIGSSPPAPKFNVISNPNDWSKAVGQASRRIADEALNERQELYLHFWTVLARFLNENDVGIKPKKPQPQMWAAFGIGRAGMHLSATISVQKQRIGAELYMHDEDAKAFYHLLLHQKEQIEAGFGEPLDWQELPEKRASRIAIYKEHTDPADESDWPNQIAWLVEKLQRLDRVFRPIIRELDPADWEKDEAEIGKAAS